MNQERRNKSCPLRGLVPDGSEAQFLHQSCSISSYDPSATKFVITLLPLTFCGDLIDTGVLWSKLYSHPRQSSVFLLYSSLDRFSGSVL